jgi:ATP-dependent DNA ligase
LSFIEAGRLRLQSRQLLDITPQFPELACLKRLPAGTVLDGELVVLRQGKPTLLEIQRRALLQDRRRIQWLSRSMPVTYMVFDLVYLKSKPLMAETLSVRRQALENLIQQTRLPGVLVPVVLSI